MFEKIPSKTRGPEKIQTPEILKCIESFETLLGNPQLKENIEKAAYSAVVSDDLSGRIPALIMSEIMKKVYAEKEENLKTFFIAPLKTNFPTRNQKKIANADAAKIKRELGDDERKVLVVTECICAGYNVEKILNSFDNSNLQADIAALRVYLHSALDKIADLLKRYESNIFIGEKGEFLHDAYSLTGLTRADDAVGMRKRDPNISPEYVRQVRKDVKLAADILYNKFFKES